MFPNHTSVSAQDKKHLDVLPDMGVLKKILDSCSKA